MSYTRLQYAEEVRSLSDTVGAITADGGWTPEAVLRYLDLAWIRRWGMILQSQPQARMQEVAVTSSLPGGTFSKSSLITSPGTANERIFFRLLQCRTNDPDPVEYAIEQYSDRPFAPRSGDRVWSPRVVREFGDQFQIIPTEALPLTCTVSYIPPRPRTAGVVDGTILDFPLGFEQVLVYDAAANVLTKGGNEVGLAAPFAKMADDMFASLLGAMRQTSAPPRVRPYTDAWEWGG